MAFIVEDGSVVADANAYITVDQFLDHHNDRGRDFNSVDVADVRAAIVKATDYIDKRFSKKLKGYRKDSSQELEFPRSDLYLSSGWRVPSDTIPSQLRKATAEYARIALALDDLLPIPARTFATIDETTGETVQSTGGALARTFDKVGPIEEERWYHDPAKQQARSGGSISDLTSAVNLPEYPMADEWMNELTNAGMPTTLGRA
jgi:hypothetical protein